MSYLLSIDQGTSSSRAIIFDTYGDIVDIAQKEITLTYPQDGWVEQNPKELVDSIVDVVRNVLEKDEGMAAQIAGAGITNQRETTIVWNKTTGDPVYNAIVWQDRRTAQYCKDLRAEGAENMVREKTGLLLDPYFSATKIRWILDNVEGAKASAERGDLLFGTVDCYLLWHLTGGKIHATDATNASRTMLYNIVDGMWDDDLLSLFGISDSMMPKVHDNIHKFGQIDPNIIKGNIVIGGMAGDQQSAMVGQGCLSPGMIKSTYGTGCFALMHIGGDFRLSENRLLTTIGLYVSGDISYALEGAIFNAGTAIQFLRDNLHAFDHAGESEKMAVSVENNGGVYFVPAFTGLGAPYWDPDARGVICGLTRDSQMAHIVRAALEAQAYQTRELIEVMAADSGKDIEVLRADGGLVANKFMCQFLADVLDVAVEIPKVAESTAWGAACLAGVQCDVFDSLEATAKDWRADKNYQPGQEKVDMDKLYDLWKRAVEKSR